MCYFMLKFLIPLNSLKKLINLHPALYIACTNALHVFFYQQSWKQQYQYFHRRMVQGVIILKLVPVSNCLVRSTPFTFYGRAYLLLFQQNQLSPPSTIFCSDSSFWITSEISFEKVSNEDGCEIQFRFRGVSTTTKSTHGSNMKQK